MSEAFEQDVLTEITIAPDGRVFVFGLSSGVLEILSQLNATDRRLEQLRRRVSNLSVAFPQAQSSGGSDR